MTELRKECKIRDFDAKSRDQIDNGATRHGWIPVVFVSLRVLRGLIIPCPALPVIEMLWQLGDRSQSASIYQLKFLLVFFIFMRTADVQGMIFLKKAISSFTAGEFFILAGASQTEQLVLPRHWGVNTSSMNAYSLYHSDSGVIRNSFLPCGGCQRYKTKRQENWYKIPVKCLRASIGRWSFP